jgi:hypothetical protein
MRNAAVVLRPAAVAQLPRPVAVVVALLVAAAVVAAAAVVVAAAVPKP